MKIKTALIINPPTGLYRRDDRCQNRVDDQTVQVTLPPLDLAYMASSLESKGIDCRIVDFPAEGLSWDDLELMFRENIDLLVVKCTGPTLEEDLHACQLAKDINPNMTTVASGMLFRELGDEFFRSHKDLDFIVWGEPESALPDLVTGKKLSEIKGIMYRENNIVKKTSYNPEESEFLNFPLPARHLLKNQIYLSPDTREPMTTIHTSRGCPFECIFCPAGYISNRQFKVRDHISIVDEIEKCINEFNIHYFLFNADTFTMNKKWVLNLCDEILRRDLNIVWAANSRADTIDREMLVQMKKSGCKILGFGVESGDDEMLRKMKKGITVEKLRKGIMLCKDVGIRTHNFFVIGLPWETKETLKKTEEFVYELDADFIDINIALPLPFTELNNIVKKEKLLERPIKGYGYSDSPVKTQVLSHEELLLARKRILLKFFLRPRYIFRTLVREAKSLKQLLYFLKYGFKHITSLIFS